MASDEPEAAELFPVIYGELRRVAGRYLSRERRNHTLQPTALVHEAWLKLQNERRGDGAGGAGAGAGAGVGAGRTGGAAAAGRSGAASEAREARRRRQADAAR